MKISATTAFALISRWMNKMAQGELEPFVGSDKISRVAFRTLADSPETMFALSTIWGAFAEPMRFEEKAAEQMIFRAAREWLALPQDDAAARTAYLDRWIHEELAYGRECRSKAAGVNQSRATYPRRAKANSPLTTQLPKDGGDVDAARNLVALGYPALAPVLPHLFQWLETNGSAVELVLRPFFAELGAPLRELACRALLNRNKPALKYSLLRYVLPSWPRDLVATLPLEGYLYDADAHGLDVWALKLMMEKRIPTHEGLEGLVAARDWKIARYKEHLNLLTSLTP
ncbi:MAG TPA: hypothetical protein VF861_04015 [Telluria sp.]